MLEMTGYERAEVEEILVSHYGGDFIFGVLIDKVEETKNYKVYEIGYEGYREKGKVKIYADGEYKLS